MLSLQFPALEKLLGKNVSELEDDDPKRGVCVIENHAFVIMDQAFLFFNLEDYFIHKYNFIAENDLSELRSILSFMNGKMFSSFFWKELTVQNAVGINDGGIAIDGVVRKDVYYKEQLFDETELRMLCMSMKDIQPMAKDTNNLHMEPLVNIITQLKTLIKEDVLILRSVGMNTWVHFTFDDNPWIYGVLQTDASLNEKQFVFDPFYDFTKDIVK